MSDIGSEAKIEQLIASHPSHGLENRPPRKIVQRTNLPLFIMLIIVLCIGLIILYSVSSPIGYAEEADSLFYVKKQLRFTAIGLGLALFLNFVDPIKLLFKRYLVLCLASGGLALVLAAVTLVAGRQYNGARRWFMIAGFQFQPSELIKVLLVVSFAAYRQYIIDIRKKGKLKAKSKRGQIFMDTMFDFIVPIMGAVVVDILILAEPHGSCAMIIAGVIAICALTSGINHRSWLIGIGIMLGVAVIFGASAYAIMPEETFTKVEEKVMGNFSHVFKRIAIFNQDETVGDKTLTKDDTRQIDNAHYALGSGGLWGVGMGESRSKYNYISEAQNDYIYSVFVEETGFVGGMFLIIVYMIFLAMCMSVIWHARNVYYRVVASGCTAIVFIEAFLNIAVELQITPSTGVTLPFVSYGGSAQIFLLVAVGFILGCSRYGSYLPAEEPEEDLVEEIAETAETSQVAEGVTE